MSLKLSKLLVENDYSSISGDYPEFSTPSVTDRRLGASLENPSAETPSPAKPPTPPPRKTKLSVFDHSILNSRNPKITLDSIRTDDILTVKGQDYFVVEDQYSRRYSNMKDLQIVAYPLKLMKEYLFFEPFLNHKEERARQETLKKLNSLKAQNGLVLTAENAHLIEPTGVFSVNDYVRIDIPTRYYLRFNHKFSTSELNAFTMTAYKVTSPMIKIREVDAVQVRPESAYNKSRPLLINTTWLRLISIKARQNPYNPYTFDR